MRWPRHPRSVVVKAASNYLSTGVYDGRAGGPPLNARSEALVAAWSRCMQKATGRHWADENALLTWLSGPSAPVPQRSQTFRRLEIRQAVADTRCAYSTGQAQTFAAEFRRAADHLPASIERQLRFLLAHRPAWVLRAREILVSSRS